MEYWVCCNFEVALKKRGKNSTRFKNTLTSWVLQNRVKLLVSHVTDPVLKSQLSTNMNLFVLPISYLAQYGEMNYKIDREVSEGNEHESTTNDILRLFSILAHPDNRDLLGALQAGKAFNRAEINGPLPWKDQIFYTVSVQFSDPSRKVTPPERSMFLKTISDMDPNDINSITRDRDFKFLKNLYTKVMKEYNFAMGKWKEGTGGGPGRPENYNDWEQRDGEAFTTYGYKVRDKYVEKDHLAWIYMLDLVTGFAFNMASDPAPDATVREDSNEGGNGTMKGKKGNNFGSTVAQFSKDFQDTVTKGFKEMTTVINVGDEKAGGRNRDDDDDIVDVTMLRIDSISARIEKVEVLIEKGKNVGRHAKRLRILEKTLDTAYSALEANDNNDDDEDSDDDDDDGDESDE